jgi:hypothetical protein
VNLSMNQMPPLICILRERFCLRWSLGDCGRRSIDAQGVRADPPGIRPVSRNRQNDTGSTTNFAVKTGTEPGTGRL